MAVLNMSTIAEALKLFYLPALVYQMNEQASVFLAQLEKTSEGVEGSKIVMALRYGMQGGIGNRADDGDLPTPNSRKTKQVSWETKNVFANIQLTDKTIEASKSNRGAFIRALEQEITDAETDAKKVLSRQVMGDGSGLLATVTAVSSASNTHTVTLDTTKNIEIGMLIDVYTGATLDTTGAEIIGVDDELNKIVFVSTTAPATDDLIYMAGNRDLELTGLAAVMTKDSTLYTLDRSQAGYKFFNPTILAINGEIDDILIQQGIDTVRKRTGAKTDMLMCNDDVKRAAMNFLRASKIIVDTMELNGGFSAVKFNGMPLTSDIYAKEGEMTGLCKEDWKMYQMADWDWMDKDGAVISRVPGKPIWQAAMRKYCDLGCQRPRGQVQFTGIAGH